MTVLTPILAGFALFVLALMAATRFGAWRIARAHPPIGAFADVNGTRMHFVHVKGPAHADLPPLVFLHGASSNLLDQMLPLRPLFEGRAEMLFLDRPGYGWSSRGPAGRNHTPAEQARTIAALMEHLGIERAIVVGHSFGGAVAAAFGLTEKARTAGLAFLSAASHPWPGAETPWYYRLTAMPVLGWLFSQTLSLPGGLLRLEDAAACVFSPNACPPTYARSAGIPLVLRPPAFRANARDVEGLHRYVTETAPRYGEIEAPAIVISGNRDTVVYEEIHSVGLARDIPGAELVWVDNLGHKPDWIAPDLVLAAVEKLAGAPLDLEVIARSVEARIAEDNHATDRCAQPELGESGELAPL